MKVVYSAAYLRKIAQAKKVEVKSPSCPLSGCKYKPKK